MNMARRAGRLLIGFLALVWTATLPAATLREHRIDFGGVKLALWEKSAAAPRHTIVLLHGRTWSSLPDFDLQVPGKSRSVMDALAARGFAVFALDLPGYGGSARLSSGWLSPEEAVAAVAATLRAPVIRGASPGKRVLFGWSYGARVTHLAAQRHAELMSEVILFGYPGDPAQRVAPEAEPASPPRQPTTQEAARSDFITPGSVDATVVAAFATAAVAATPVRSDWRRLEQWNEVAPEKLQLPVLLLHGVFDPYTPVDAQARSFTRFGHPDRQWVILPHSDHAAQLENAHEAFIAAIVNFVHRPSAK